MLAVVEELRYEISKNKMVEPRHIFVWKHMYVYWSSRVPGLAIAVPPPEGLFITVSPGFPETRFM